MSLGDKASVFVRGLSGPCREWRMKPKTHARKAALIENLDIEPETSREFKTELETLPFATSVTVMTDSHVCCLSLS